MNTENGLKCVHYTNTLKKDVQIKTKKGQIFNIKPNGIYEVSRDDWFDNYITHVKLKKSKKFIVI